MSYITDSLSLFLAISTAIPYTLLLIAVIVSFQIKSRSIILDGHKPGPVIVEEAVNEKVDTIVIGTRGLGTLRRTVLGSVTDYVVHNSPIPVTVVPPESWKHHYPHH